MTLSVISQVKESETCISYVFEQSEYETFINKCIVCGFRINWGEEGNTKSTLI